MKLILSIMVLFTSIFSLAEELKEYPTAPLITFSILSKTDARFDDFEITNSGEVIRNRFQDEYSTEDIKNILEKDKDFSHLRKNFVLLQIKLNSDLQLMHNLFLKYSCLPSGAKINERNKYIIPFINVKISYAKNQIFSVSHGIFVPSGYPLVGSDSLNYYFSSSKMEFSIDTIRGEKNILKKIDWDLVEYDLRKQIDEINTSLLKRICN